MKDFIVHWSTVVGMGYTYYEGKQKVRAISMEHAIQLAKKQIAKELDRRQSDINVSKVETA